MAAAPRVIASIGRIEVWRHGDSITIAERIDGRNHRYNEPKDITLTLTQWRHICRATAEE